MTFRVINGGEQVVAYEGRPFDLSDQPMRPGLAHESLTLRVDDELAASVQRAAAAEGVPAALWATIAVESERALHAAVAAVGGQPDILAEALDRQARPNDALGRVGSGRRLGAYARALRRGDSPAAGAPLCLAVPYHSLVAWQSEAAIQGRPVAAWAAGMLMALPTGRVSWEAAAAEQGQTLAEWVALQAARCSSR